MMRERAAKRGAVKSGDVSFGRTEMGEDLYRIMTRIERCPREPGAARSRAVKSITSRVEAFRKRWNKDAFRLIKFLVER